TTKTLTKYYDPVEMKVVNKMNNKIAGYSTFSTTASIQTTLYGQANFKKGSTIEAIRHVVTPSIGFTYSPDFGDTKFGYYKNYYTANGALTPYSIFENNGIIGSPTTGMVGALNFNIGNNIEMKVKSKSDSTGLKKVKIFESLSLAGNYNFAAKDHPWSIMTINGQSSFFNNKLTVNTSLSLDPYRIIFEPGAETGIRTEDFGHFSLQGFNVQMSYPLSSEIFGEKVDYPKKYPAKGDIRNEVYYFDDDNYAHFDQAWTLNISTNYQYSKGLSKTPNRMASLGLDGSIKLTPYWNITGSTHYDLVTKDLALTRIGFSRDQRSFTINFNWVPFGRYKVYDFFIGIKANILSDALKYKDRSFTQPNAPF
ncbi:MAG: LPS-assembly protein LptD, partial [Chryseobacterium sp.]